MYKSFRHFTPSSGKLKRSYSFLCFILLFVVVYPSSFKFTPLRHKVLKALVNFVSVCHLLVSTWKKEKRNLFYDLTSWKNCFLLLMWQHWNRTLNNWRRNSSTSSQLYQFLFLFHANLFLCVWFPLSGSHVSQPLLELQNLSVTSFCQRSWKRFLVSFFFLFFPQVAFRCEFETEPVSGPSFFRFGVTACVHIYIYQ